MKSHSKALYEGFRDGIPIGLGYLAVSFSLGVAARSAGLTAFQGFLASLLNNASAGEYAGFTVIAANASYFEMFFIIDNQKNISKKEFGKIHPNPSFQIFIVVVQFLQFQLLLLLLFVLVYNSLLFGLF